MRLNEHFDNGDEVKEECQTTEMHAGPAPALSRVEHSRKNGDTCRRVKNGRDSEPEQMHTDFTLKAYPSVYCDASFPFRIERWRQDG
jgi:hypothetical protein